MAQRKNISAQVRRQVAERDGYRCCYCRSVVPLFHPCMQEWHKHFAWSEDGLRIHGLTAIGRATAEALRLNNDWLVRARRIGISAGLHPPLE